MTTKVHWTPPAKNYGRGVIRTACGRNGMECRGFPPRPNHPGEYDDDWCNRFEATPHQCDVTCRTCRRAVERVEVRDRRI